MISKNAPFLLRYFKSVSGPVFLLLWKQSQHWMLNCVDVELRAIIVCASLYQPNGLRFSRRKPLFVLRDKQLSLRCLYKVCKILQSDLQVFFKRARDSN